MQSANFCCSVLPSLVHSFSQLLCPSTKMESTDVGSKSVPLQITEGTLFRTSEHSGHVFEGGSSCRTVLLAPFRSCIRGMTLFFVFADEAAVYDRQIRLWGLEAQQRCARPHGATILPPRSERADA